MKEQLFLIAHIAGRGVAIDSAQVESVVDIGHVTPTPRVARHIRGLAALRSRVVTVIDTHAALGLPPITTRFWSIRSKMSRRSWHHRCRRAWPSMPHGAGPDAVRSNATASQSWRSI